MFSRPKPAPGKMRLLPLIAATYFMVSGGPYGIEDILGGAGYGWAIVILLLSAHLLEPAHRAHDRRTGQRHSRRRRLLRLGTPRARPVLGIPGKLALALGQHLRHGSLPIDLRALSRQVCTRAHCGMAEATLGRWRLSLLCCLWNLRGAPAVGEGSMWLFVLLALAVRGLRRSRHFGAAFCCTPPCSGAVRPRSALNRRWLRILDRSARGHVELHGLGQRIHRRAGS